MKFMKKRSNRYSTGWADYPGAGRIYDTDVAKYVRKHTHWWDRYVYSNRLTDIIRLRLYAETIQIVSVVSINILNTLQIRR